MNRILNQLRRLVLWLTAVDQPGDAHLTPADWADLPPYHEPTPHS